MFARLKNVVVDFRPNITSSNQVRSQKLRYRIIDDGRPFSDLYFWEHFQGVRCKQSQQIFNICRSEMVVVPSSICIGGLGCKNLTFHFTIKIVDIVGEVNYTIHFICFDIEHFQWSVPKSGYKKEFFYIL